MLREEGRKKGEKKTLTNMTHVKVIDPLRPTFAADVNVGDHNKPSINFINKKEVA